MKRNWTCNHYNYHKKYFLNVENPIKLKKTVQTNDKVKIMIVMTEQYAIPTKSSTIQQFVVNVLKEKNVLKNITKLSLESAKKHMNEMIKKWVELKQNI